MAPPLNRTILIRINRHLRITFNMKDRNQNKKNRDNREKKKRKKSITIKKTTK